MINVLPCCQSCICKIMLEDNVVCATFIICITILLIVISFLIYSNKKSNQRFELEKDKMNIEKQTTEHKIEQEKIKGKVPTETEKRKKDFLDYCYKMAKSLEKGNEKQREDCWKILLHIHADCIPDELKQEYKVGNNAVENVGKTE